MSAEATGWVFRCSPYKGAAFAVHLALADSANDQHGYEVWARQAWVAEKARTTRQTVNTVFATMVDDGLLEVLEESCGRRGPNRYRLVLDDRRSVWTPTATVGSADIQLSATATPGVGSHDIQVSALMTQNPIDNPTENPKEKTITRADRFDDFWTVYPRKVAKASARKAFNKLDPDLVDSVIAGAIRYRDDPNREPAFTRHATTWLNAGCWEDEPLPSRTNGNNRRQPERLDRNRDQPAGVLEL